MGHDVVHGDGSTAKLRFFGWAECAAQEQLDRSDMWAYLLVTLTECTADSNSGC